MSPQPELNFFQGETFEPARDGARLNRQLDAVRKLMSDGKWRTLEQISEATGAPQASVSARLRDSRTVRGGSFIVERRYVSRGLHEYRFAGHQN
jgi:hypothetical protein